MQKLLTFFFSKNISVYAIFNDQNFNNALTNDIVSFEQLGPGVQESEQEVTNNGSKVFSFRADLVLEGTCLDWLQSFLHFLCHSFFHFL